MVSSVVEKNFEESLAAVHTCILLTGVAEAHNRQYYVLLLAVHFPVDLLFFDTFHRVHDAFLQ